MYVNHLLFCIVICDVLVCLMLFLLSDCVSLTVVICPQPNGRFEIFKKICLSISGHHPESWQPSWSSEFGLSFHFGFHLWTVTGDSILQVSRLCIVTLQGCYHFE